MTLLQWFVFFLLLQVVHFLGTWKLYIKAGRKAWEAAIPVYNAIVLMQIINRPKWWTILLFIPIINLIIFPVIWVETARSFGKNSTIDTILSIVSLGLYNYYINYTQEVTHIKDRSLSPKTGFGEWVSSILFAVVAATIVHTYFMQPFVIPTSSLEKTLLKGDFLLVSKFHYGARLPMTVVAAPMVHDTLPFIKSPSYLKKPQLPYLRLPGFQKIKNNDIVVFNWPADTLFNMYKAADRKYEKPIDKKTNYVKRCVGIAGDSLEIKDGYVFVNGKQINLPDRAKTQFYYTVISKSHLSVNYLKNNIGTTEFNKFYKISPEAAKHYKLHNTLPFPNDPINRLVELPGSYDLSQNPDFKATDRYNINMSVEEKERLSKNTNITSITRNIKPKGERESNIFPRYGNFNWNGDNFGPIYIPEAGKTVALNTNVLPLYKDIITEYEGNNLTVDGETIYINGQESNSYTFAQNYYWMMGDNRQNSLDARYWGYVPFDHVIGKPVFVWMSISGVELGLKNIKNWVINTNRVFTTVGGSGKPTSYFPYFIALIVLWQGYVFYKKRKK